MRWRICTLTEKELDALVNKIVEIASSGGRVDSFKELLVWKEIETVPKHEAEEPWSGKTERRIAARRKWKPFNKKYDRKG